MTYYVVDIDWLQELPGICHKSTLIWRQKKKEKKNKTKKQSINKQINKIKLQI